MLGILVVVAIGVALGVFCGGLLLACVVVYMKRSDSLIHYSPVNGLYIVMVNLVADLNAQNKNRPTNHSSPMLYPTIRLHNRCFIVGYLLFSVFVFYNLFSLYGHYFQ